MKNKKPKIDVLLHDSYIAVIRNSRGTRMFRTYVALMDGRRQDITEDGNKSCALFVSSILVMFGLLDSVQVTVHRTIDRMERGGWKHIKKPKKGCVLVWKEHKYANGGLRKHIGFYIGNDQAVSNSSRRGCPVIHDYKMYNGRGLLTMLWHPKLERK